VTGSRRRAREAALRILYFWEVGRAEPQAAVDVYFREHAPDAPAAVVDFATTIVTGTVAEVATLDKLIEEHSQHWRLERLAVVDRLILRMSVWELRHRADTPPAVILNEAIELTRRFSTADAVKFVNGVLDGILKALEAAESTADHHPR
jgi:N utilization substance protein B